MFHIDPTFQSVIFIIVFAALLVGLIGCIEEAFRD